MSTYEIRPISFSDPKLIAKNTRTYSINLNENFTFKDLITFEMYEKFLKGLSYRNMRVIG